jgi:hypothetical protein
MSIASIPVSTAAFVFRHLMSVSPFRCLDGATGMPEETRGSIQDFSGMLFRESGKKVAATEKLLMARPLAAR